MEGAPARVFAALRAATLSCHARRRPSPPTASRFEAPSYVWRFPLLRGILRTKKLSAILASVEAPEGSLKRSLGVVQLTLLGIGAIIGAGIFSTVGTAAAGGGEHLGAGPGILLSFVLTAITCGFAALCYAEFASMVPVSSSAYTYS